MRYAVVQKTLDAPKLEQLTRAFRSVPTLTAADAATVVHDAYGVLVKFQAFDDACILEQALRSEGIESVVVSHDDLPRMPQARHVRRVDFSAEALMVNDPLGRSFPVPWGNIMLIAAGAVRSHQARSARSEEHSITHLAAHHLLSQEAFEEGLKHMQFLDDARVLHDLEVHLLIEIVLSRAVLRYSIDAEEFDFSILGERRTRSLRSNFALLLQDMIQHTPDAVLNRGAFYLKGEDPEVFVYPNKNAFHEEAIWLMWRIRQAQQQPGR